MARGFTFDELQQDGGTAATTSGRGFTLEELNQPQPDQEATGIFSRVVPWEKVSDKPKSTLSFLPEELQRTSAAAYQGFQELPPIKYGSMLTGGAVALAGGVIGGAVGAAGGFVEGVLKEEGVWATMLKRALDTAKKTGSLGYQIGKTAPTIAASMAGGAAVNVPLALGQLASGTAKTQKAYESGKVSDWADAAVDVGLGILSFNFAAQQLKGAGMKDLFKLPSLTGETVVGTPGVMVSKDIADQFRYLASPDKKFNDAKKAVDNFIGSKKPVLSAQGRLASKASATGEAQPDLNVFITKNGLVPDIKQIGGKRLYDSSRAIQTAQESADVVDDMLGGAMDELHPEARHNLESIKESVSAQAAKRVGGGAELEKKTAQMVADFFDAEIVKRGSDVPTGELVEIKRALYKRGGYSKMTLPEASKAYRSAGEVMADGIELAYKGELDVNAVNKVLGQYYETIRVLDGLDNIPIPKGVSSVEKIGSLVGNYVGRSSGIPIAGTYLGYNGGQIANLIDQSDYQSIKTIGAWLKTNPQTDAKVIMDIMSKQVSGTKAAREAMPKLPPAPAPGTAENPIIGQAPSVTETELGSWQLGVPKPKDVSSVKAYRPEAPKGTTATVRAFKIATGKTPTATTFKFDPDNLIMGQNGRIYEYIPGTIPRLLGNQEINELKRGGVKMPTDYSVDVLKDVPEGMRVLLNDAYKSLNEGRLSGAIRTIETYLIESGMGALQAKETAEKFITGLLKSGQ